MPKVETVEVEGPAGQIIINEADLEMYKRKGYAVVGGAEPAEGSDQSEESLTAEDLESMTVVELRRLAISHGTPMSALVDLDKDELIERLTNGTDDTDDTDDIDDTDDTDDTDGTDGTDDD